MYNNCTCLVLIHEFSNEKLFSNNLQTGQSTQFPPYTTPLTTPEDFGAIAEANTFDPTIKSLND